MHCLPAYTYHCIQTFAWRRKRRVQQLYSNKHKVECCRLKIVSSWTSSIQLELFPSAATFQKTNLITDSEVGLLGAALIGVLIESVAIVLIGAIHEIIICPSYTLLFSPALDKELILRAFWRSNLKALSFWRWLVSEKKEQWLSSIKLFYFIIIFCTSFTFQL
jgi:hypothetical protein